MAHFNRALCQCCHDLLYARCVFSHRPTLEYRYHSLFGCHVNVTCTKLDGPVSAKLCVGAVMTLAACPLCLQTHGSPSQHHCTLKVLAMMIERVTSFPELARDVGTTKMKALLPAVLALTSKVSQVLGLISFFLRSSIGGGSVCDRF